MLGHLPVIALVMLGATAPREVRRAPKSIVASPGAVRLNIADRKHDPAAPKEGWCGENAIQQAMLYHGAYVPQRLINKAGKPTHPDLYSRDVPVALRNLGMDIDYWRGGRSPYSKFEAWMRQHIKGGEPILAGMKIYPTAHPEWGLDHFVLVVGYDKDALLVNTTWGKQEKLTTKQLLSTKKGLAFKNRQGSYYGIRIKGPKGLPASSRPVRLFVEKETKTHLAVIVKCEGLTPGHTYEVSRRASLESRSPDHAFRLQASGPAFAFRATLAKSRPAYYRCRRADHMARHDSRSREHPK